MGGQKLLLWRWNVFIVKQLAGFWSIAFSLFYYSYLICQRQGFTKACTCKGASQLITKTDLQLRTDNEKVQTPMIPNIEYYTVLHDNLEIG